MTDRTRTDPGPARRGGARRGWALFCAFAPDLAFVGARRVLAPGEAIELGRGGDGLVPGALDDPLLSRRHARLAADGEGLAAVDLGSHNGLWVDGARAAEAAVPDGAVLGFGSQLWVARRVTLGEEPDPASPWRGVGPAAAGLHALVAELAPLREPVLIVGPPGAGKELVARELHARSGRPGPLVVLECTSVSEPLLLAELMGHERSAFTGADRARAGLARAADRGTLFVDEVADASPALQGALLRLAQEGEVRPLGSDRPLPTSARLVAATHRDPWSEAARGAFRADLLSRLEHFVIRVPALRDRREDVGPLAVGFAAAHGARPTREGMAQLLRRDWPGNVRELRAVIDRAAIGAAGGELRLPEAAPDARPRDLPAAPDLRRALAEAGSVPALARRLGVGRTTAYRWLKEAGVDPRSR